MTSRPPVSTQRSTWSSAARTEGALSTGRTFARASRSSSIVFLPDSLDVGAFAVVGGAADDRRRDRVSGSQGRCDAGGAQEAGQVAGRERVAGADDVDDPHLPGQHADNGAVRPERGRRARTVLDDEFG